MWKVSREARVFLAIGATDLRKAANGLSILVQEQLEDRLFSGDLFAFCNRGRKLVKVLYWSGKGFCLWQMRLEKQRFKWPESEQEVTAIDQQQMSWLLDGLDISQAHKRLNFTTNY